MGIELDCPEVELVVLSAVRVVRSPRALGEQLPHGACCVGYWVTSVMAEVCSVPPVWNCRNIRYLPGSGTVAWKLNCGPP